MLHPYQYVRMPFTPESNGTDNEVFNRWPHLRLTNSLLN